MLTYLLKATLCWAVFYLVYHLLLGRETFFRLNRWYLLVTAVLGAVIPAIQFDFFMAEETPSAIYYLQPITVGVEQLEAVIVTASETGQGVDFWQMLVGVYWLGVVVTMARFGYGLYQVSTLYRTGEVARANGYWFVSTPLPHLPFSFFKNLFWSTNFQVSEEDRRSIVRHEEAHIYQWHSLDVVLLELLGILCWCSPFVYLYKKAVKTNHEYLADAYVTEGFSKKQYGRLLLRQSQTGMQIAISNSLFSSHLKNRIVMMTKNKSSKRATLKYLAALPALAMLLFAFTFTQKDGNGLTGHDAATTVTDTLPDGEVFKMVEEMPRFPGCEEMTDAAEREKCAQTKMLEFVYKNIKYPAMARENGVQGISAVKFIVEKDGSISDAETAKAIGSGCDEEVLKVVYMMPNWIPGKQGGREVRTQFVLPVKFKLEGEAEKPLLVVNGTVQRKMELNDMDPSIIENVEVMKGEKAMPIYGEAARHGALLVTTKKGQEKAAEKPAKAQPDQQPRFSGCETAADQDACSTEKLFAFVGENMKYPELAKKAGVEGMVVVKFIVGEDGAIRNAEAVKTIGGGCDEEALRVVNAMPNWVPGVKDGKTVAAEMALPFKFALPADEASKKAPAAAPGLELLEVFPNPVSGENFSVRFKATAGKVTLMFRDVSGKDVMEKAFPDYDGSERTERIITKGLFENKAGKGTVFVSLFDEKGNLLGSTTFVVQ